MRRDTDPAPLSLRWPIGHHPGMSVQSPDEAEVARILSIRDRVLRNLWITQCYHELAVAYAARVPGRANWCTFATWASRQAGQTIRGEDLKRALERAFAASPDASRKLEDVTRAVGALGVRVDTTEVRRIVMRLLGTEEPFEAASAAVARGNAKVFEEIGREFARFLGACGADSSFDEASIAEFCARLRPGEPPDGQTLLAQAFARYYRVLFEPDGQRRSEMQLLANLEVGLHEQTRLQPDIREALDAAVPDPDELTARLLRELLPYSGVFARARRFVKRLIGGPTPLDLAVRGLVSALRAEARRVITDHLMTLALPPGVILRLGHDLRAQFPESLLHLTDPELLALLTRIDPTPDSLQGSGARDWADLAERMHFIADLFRCKHETSELFDTPFTVEQLAALRAGRVPAGRL